MASTGTQTILIVDDVAENLSVLNTLLRPEFEVRAAASGDKALRVAGAHPRPDLILLDVMMPGLDGYQVFERLRADHYTRDIPVIFLTKGPILYAEARDIIVERSGQHFDPEVVDAFVQVF